MYIGLNIKYPLVLSDFNQTWILLAEFQKNKYQISWKSIQWEPSCTMQKDTWAQGGTDRHDEANSQF